MHRGQDRQFVWRSIEHERDAMIRQQKFRLNPIKLNKMEKQTQTQNPIKLEK
jgi:hypothetical protein